MRAGDVLLLALLAGAGGVIGAVVRGYGYAAAGRVDAPSTEAAERPPGTKRHRHDPIECGCELAPGGGYLIQRPPRPDRAPEPPPPSSGGAAPVRHMTYVGGPHRRGPGRPGPLEPLDGCDIPPHGWWCSRDRGHDGPCAARQAGELP